MVRSSFKNFFETKGHKIYPPSSLMPAEKDTTMFTVAGMQQFRDFFLKTRLPEYKRIATIQPCLRLGGKRCDLDQVGKTRRHNTFFEMCGNFSFGDYFQEEAIDFAYEYLTEVLNIPKDYLYFTTYHTDQVAFNYWQEKSPGKTVKIFTDDNFWSSGTYGPCGPCTEIFFDTEKRSPSLSDFEADLSIGGERFVEIWNLVFMQYNKTPRGLEELEDKNVDTGFGLERMVSILDGSYDNYKTDLLCEAVSEAAKFTKNSTDARIVSDHVKSICFLVSEGLTPDKDNREYMLRRLLRRVLFRCKNPISVAKAVIRSSNEYEFHLEKIEKVFSQEEEAFEEVLKKTATYLEEEPLDEKYAFKLYETHGIPLDLTKEIAEQKGIILSEEKLAIAAQEHVHKSLFKTSVSYDIPTKILCYESTENESYVVHFEEASQNSKVSQTGNLSPVDTSPNITQNAENTISNTPNKSDRSKNIKENVSVPAEKDLDIYLITKESCFYGRSGGQEGDQGYIENEKGKFRVKDTLKQKISFEESIIIHKGFFERGFFSVGDKVDLFVDKSLREARTRAHSATHIAGEFLTRKYGMYLKGSKVDEDELHFDVESKEHLDLEELNNWTNKSIQEAVAVEILFQKKEEVKDALLLEGHNYGQEVRVISIPGFSKQLCGGTHVKNTSEIQAFLALKDFSIKKGVRRIEALTGKKAISYVKSSLVKKEEISTEISAPEIINILGYEICYFSSCTEKAAFEQFDKNHDAIVIYNSEGGCKIILSDKYKVLVENLSQIGFKGGGNKIIRMGTAEKKLFSDLKELLERIFSGPQTLAEKVLNLF